MRNAILGALGGALVTGAILSQTGAGSVAAQARPVRPAPLSGRFQLTATARGAMLLDSGTGCVWEFTPQLQPSTRDSATNNFIVQLGDHFDVVHFNAGEIAPTGAGTKTGDPAADAYIKAHPELFGGGDRGLAAQAVEFQREAALCDRVRVNALESAAAR